MNSIPLRVIFCALSVSGALALYAHQEPPSPKASLANIRGVIRDAITHQPISEARVELKTEKGSQSTATGPKGEYDFRNVGAGRCSLSISKTGYSTLNEFVLDSGTVFTLGSGESTSRDYDLTPQGSITGTITDDDSDQPAPGVRIIPMREDYFMGKKRYLIVTSATSDTSGKYSIGNLAPGRYWLEISGGPSVAIQNSEPGRQTVNSTRSYGHSFYPGVPRIEMAAPIFVRPADVQQMDFRLHKRSLGCVRGTLQSPETSSGATPINLQLQQNSPGLFRVIAKAALTSGPFEICNLDEGEYNIVAATAGSTSDPFYAEYRLSMGTRDIDDLTITMQHGLTIEGSVLFAEGESGGTLDGMWVGLDPLERPRTDQDRNVRVSSTGQLRLQGVRPGEYWAFFEGLPKGYQVTHIRYSSSNSFSAPIKPDAVLGNPRLEFVISAKLGSVLGSVHDSEGKAVSDATVVLVPSPVPDQLAPYAVRTTSSGRQGEFGFEALAPGKYLAIVLLGQESRRYRDVDLIRQKALQAATFEVGADKVVSVSVKP